MNSKALIAELVADGWILIRVTGSHHHFRHPIKRGLVTVPHPKKDLPVGTVKSIRRQASYENPLALPWR
ncbi:type II toxin-antitoxin system HicA family toxin [Trabulsiella odontotermitis]|uniref:type II toxin-antitoxin system HicA family toxin n=1 Tax=Trabulsiella odontotermitis TaxID=379893 RepID=UPI0006BA6847|nr:type II toxin-antitoxin system HicA family toxin [Trabulsiella odontotermitis]